jgi:hypothetical protein
MDMMVNAVLKATGFVREDFDKGVATAKQKAVDFERRFETLEANIGEILSIVRRMPAEAIPQTPRAADAQDTDHAG